MLKFRRLLYGLIGVIIASSTACSAPAGKPEPSVVVPQVIQTMPATQPSRTLALISSQPSQTQVTKPPTTLAPVTSPPVTNPPATQPPITQAAITAAPTTKPPVTIAPATKPPVTKAPATKPPATKAPATKPASTKPPSTIAATKPSTSPSVGEIPEDYNYILNKNTKKFHKPDCGSVKLMNESNKWYFEGSRQEAISEGYVPCKICRP